ncbi:Ran-binding protein 9 [Entomortierella lignicola]|nr:Ran-binding protein 9 [Entomortierella lignicola]
MDLDSELNGSDKVDTAIPRQLVLDYLLHNCYGETARAFMKDDLDTGKDSELRKNGTTHAIHNGINGNGITNGSSNLLNGSNGIPSGTASHIQGSLMTRISSDDSQRRMETEKEEELDQEGDSPMGESYIGTKDDLSASTLTADKAHALYIDEQLKNLETRKAIRNLISHGDIEPAMELCNSAFPGVLSIDPHSPLTTPASIRMNFKLQCQKFIEIVKADPERGHHALMFAQKVLRDFQQLDPAGKDMYEKNMVEIISIIAYRDPEESPHARQLKQEARDHLADIMNSAVLGYNGMSCEPALLTIVKQTTLVRECLAGESSKTKRGLKVPSKWRLSTFLEESS